MKKKHRLAYACLVFGFASVSQAEIIDFDDIDFWVGEGASRAAMIIDFNDGATSESFAWGYKWDGVASGADMFIAISEADTNLTLGYANSAAADFYTTSLAYFDGVDSHSATGGFVDTVYYSLGYYLNGGFAGETAGNPNAVSGGGVMLPGSWAVSPTGAAQSSFGESGRLLADGAWDAWSFGANDASWNHVAPPGGTVVAAAIPEPGTITLMMLGAGGMVWFRKRRQYIFR